MTTRRGAPPPQISVVIPTSDRPEALRSCLVSLQEQREAPAWELIVSAPPDPAIHELITSLVPSATVVTVANGSPAMRRNAVLARATGDVLLFLDDDVVVPEHYLHRLGELQRKHPEIEVFGGPNVTPYGSSSFQVVQGAVLSSAIGSGPVRRRYGPHPPADADERWFTLCNLAIRRTRMASFDADLVCAEENELLERLRRSGTRMRYEPELWAAHDRRPDLSGFATQMYKYGRGRGQLARRAPRTLRPAHLVPSLTLLGILALAIAAGATGRAWIFALAAAYPLALLVQAMKVAATLRRPAAVAAAFGITAVLHACYGTGVLVGLSEPATGPARRAPMRRWQVLWVLVRRQLLLLRKRSMLGLLWPLLTPWVMLVLYSFVFHSVLNVPISRYGIFLFAGLLPWSFLAQTLGSSVTSLSVEADLIRRRKFSYSLLPLAMEIAASAYFLITLAGFIGYLAIRGDLRWATLPVILLPVASLYLFVGATACVLAVIDVYNRDLRQMLNNILTVWFFLVPIVYQQSMLSHRLLFTRSIDPANLIVGEFRDVLYAGHITEPLHYVVVLLASGGLLLLATGLIRRLGTSLPKDV